MVQTLAQTLSGNAEGAALVAKLALGAQVSQLVDRLNDVPSVQKTHALGWYDLSIAAISAKREAGSA